MTGTGRVLAVVAAAVVVGLGSACSGGSSAADIAPSVASPSDVATPSATTAPEVAAPPVTSPAGPTPSRTPSPTARPTPSRSIGVRTLAPSQRPTEYASAAAATCRMTAGLQSAGGRSYLLTLPATRTAVAVVVDFHGGNQNAAQEFAYSGLSQRGPLTNYAVVTPEGTNGLWNFTGSEPGLPNDVAFVQQIAADLQQAGCSNGALYTTGISDGADMAVYAACTLPGVRAVYAVAPSITPRGACTRKPYVEVHGTADPVVPYTGSAPGSFADVPSEPVASRITYWAATCGQPATTTKPGTGVQLWRCGDGRTVELDTVNGGGHTWPGAAPNPPLGTTASWNGAQAALRFFGAH